MHRSSAALAFALFAANICAADAPHAKEVSAVEFLSGACDGHRVTLKASVTDVIRDETNPIFSFLVLVSDGETIYAPIKNAHGAVEGLVGARIRTTGLCDAYIPEPRRQLGRQLYIASTNDITTILPAPGDMFAVPEIGDTRLMTPSEISRLGRRRTEGRVLASWSGDQSLLKTPDGRLVRISFAECTAPRHGDSVEVVGRPVSDLYRVNLERAKWRRVEPIDIPAPATTNISAAEIMLSENGQAEIKPGFLGATVTISGIVAGRQSAGDDTVLNIEDGDFTVPIYTKADAEKGCVIKATGTCILDIENWNPNAAFPQIKGFFVVTRNEHDITILSWPPRWAAGRLFAVIAFLVAVIGAVLVWNSSLRRRVERRSRELLKAQISGLKSVLKVSERTRLAAELHDSLAQNLTGVAMKIDAAKKKLAHGSAADAVRHLDFASNAIDACREELRNCIWDLRGKALDEPDMNKAVQYALMPHIGEARLVCRFSAKRSKLSDAAAHAAIMITRELATNAVRHGAATVVRIAGCIDRGALKFSIEDNGCGFDPESAPGIDQGHFGIQGIRERIGAFNGKFTITSSYGRGTRAEAMLRLDADRDET